MSIITSSECVYSLKSVFKILTYAIKLLIKNLNYSQSADKIVIKFYIYSLVLVYAICCVSH